MFVVTANALCTLADAFSRNKDVGAIFMCVCVCVRAGERVFSLCYWLEQFLNERSARFSLAVTMPHISKNSENWSWEIGLIHAHCCKVYSDHIRVQQLHFLQLEKIVQQNTFRANNSAIVFVLALYICLFVYNAFAWDLRFLVALFYFIYSFSL